MGSQPGRNVINKLGKVVGKIGAIVAETISALKFVYKPFMLMDVACNASRLLKIVILDMWLCRKHIITPGTLV